MFSILINKSICNLEPKILTVQPYLDERHPDIFPKDIFPTPCVHRGIWGACPPPGND